MPLPGARLILLATVRILIVIVLLAAAGGAVMLRDRGESARAWPDALELLRRSDEVMAEVRSVRVNYSVYPPPPDSPDAPYEWPEQYDIDLLDGRCVRTNQEGAECSCSSEEAVWPYFARAHGGQVSGEPYWGATAAENVRVTGVGLISGRLMWVIDYHLQLSGFEGSYLVERREWIDQGNFLLRRQDERNHHPLSDEGTVRADLSMFNEIDECS